MSGGFWLTLGLSVIGVVADVFIKRASDGPGMMSWQFLLGEGLYIASAPAWFFAMQRLNLANVGALYSVSQAVMLTMAGLIVFREQIGIRDAIGLVLAVVSVMLLSRGEA